MSEIAATPGPEREAEQFAQWLSVRIDGPAEQNAVIAWLEGTKPRDVIAALRREAA